MPNEIEDDMAASAVSLEISNLCRSFHTNSLVTTDKKAKGKSPLCVSKENEPTLTFLLSPEQRNDLENPVLFKKKAWPKCVIMKHGSDYVLQDKTKSAAQMTNMKVLAQKGANHDLRIQKWQ